jgi:hypothetical protein
MSTPNPWVHTVIFLAIFAAVLIIIVGIEGACLYSAEKALSLNQDMTLFAPLTSFHIPNLGQWGPNVWGDVAPTP